jgi:hypothetical protein
MQLSVVCNNNFRGDAEIVTWGLILVKHLSADRLSKTRAYKVEIFAAHKNQLEHLATGPACEKPVTTSTMAHFLAAAQEMGSSKGWGLIESGEVWRMKVDFPENVCGA